MCSITAIATGPARPQAGFHSALGQRTDLASTGSGRYRLLMSTGGRVGLPAFVQKINRHSSSVQAHAREALAWQFAE